MKMKFLELKCYLKEHKPYDIGYVKLDDMLKTNDDICLYIAKYCDKNNLLFEFIKRISSIIAMIE